MNVWVVFASKYGSTREVAEAIAEELGRVHDVRVRDAAEVKSFDGADAVVLGSAIYAGHWLSRHARCSRSGSMSWRLAQPGCSASARSAIHRSPRTQAPSGSQRRWMPCEHAVTRSSLASSTTPHSAVSSG